MRLTEHVTTFVDREFAREMAFLAELVKVPSDNPPGDCAAHGARAKALLEGVGFAVETHPVPSDLAKACGMVSATNLIVRHRFGGPTQDYVERFESMNLPLLVIAGTNDDLAPPASVRPAYERSRSRDRTYKTMPLGHIDLLVGRDAPLSTWPLVTNWIGKRTAA